ncbi:MAG: hypothetical protein IT373_00785 [Polyangiaceae bacterium]|nr:hypothetical protein [Polyangiaceae bacterium]
MNIDAFRPLLRATVALGLAAGLLGACREQQAKKQEADGLMCSDAPEAAAACGGEWCAEHGVAEADCRICNTDAGAAARKAP